MAPNYSLNKNMKMKTPSLLPVFLFSFILILSIQTSCTKERIIERTEKDTVYKCSTTIHGLWIGSQFSSVSSLGQPFNVSIKPDGKMTYENIVSGTQQFSVGTWTLVGTAFEGNIECIYGYFVGVKQKLTATFNPTTGTLISGKWENTFPLSNTDKGTFTLTKHY